ncbi:MAG: phosphatidate cytidylyltransferase [Rhizobiaceae bacterium]|nr:MAG: phosphatidate cytidylyltransferase [Rhizobiaceae bacterium]
MSETGPEPLPPDLQSRRKGGFADAGMRALSALVLAAVAIAATWMGGFAFRVLIVVGSAVIFAEWIGMARKAGRSPRWLVPALALAALELSLFTQDSGVVLSVLLVGIACSWATGFFAGRYHAGLAALAYAGFSAVALAFLRDDDRAGLYAILFLFSVVWATDVMAYFCGRLFGGPKLAPSISPGKTWSGAIGGTAGGIVAAFVFLFCIGRQPTVGTGIAALALSVVGQVGDLFESAVKRRYGVKDSSNLIPGHGGLMDRIDALVAAAFTLYLIGGIMAGFDLPAHGLFRP